MKKTTKSKKPALGSANDADGEASAPPEIDEALTRELQEVAAKAPADDLEADVSAMDGVTPVEEDEGVGLQELSFDIKHDLQKRVDLYLRDRLPDYSRAMLQKLVKAGSVMVNGRAAKSSTVLRSGDSVRVTLPKLSPQEALPENIPLNIVHEDEQFIAVNKQAKLIVHPARGHWNGTLINALLWHAKETNGTLSTGSDAWRPGIIHRLDRDTTGLILIGKTDEAHWRLAGQFERRTIKKTYMAIVHGEMELESDLIDAPLAIHPRMREKYAVREDIGKPAQTVYVVKERFKGYTLLELLPKTGRTHQLRVHLSHVGHPIVGDVMYGGKAITLRDIVGDAHQSKGAAQANWEKPLIERQALHAFRLQFVHPTKFTRMHLEAPMPPDMEHIVNLLREWRKGK
jgi:23S rRNA pseudouridine1911/1915/1917 synthase